MTDEHVCDACRPILEEQTAMAERERRGDPPPGDESYAAARFRLDEALYLCREAMCDGHADYRPPGFVRPGGEMRYEYQQRRIETSCAPCADIAESASLMEMWRHVHASRVQEIELADDTGGVLDEDGYTTAREQLWAFEIRAEEARKLLRRCEQIHCGDPLSKAAQDLGDSLVDDDGPWTETPQDPPGGIETVEGVPTDDGPRGRPTEGGAPPAGGGLSWKVLVPLLGIVGVLIAIGIVTIGGDSDDADATTGTQDRAATPSTEGAGVSTGGTGQGTSGPDTAGVFKASPAAAAAHAAIAGQSDDPDGALDCVADGLALAGVSEADVGAMGDPDVSTWPSGLADLYAGVLEVCAPLEPYYLGWFGSYDFQDDSCVRTMTDFVLADYSWRRFLDEGILDDDRRPQLQAEFDAFVTDGYGANGCFAG